LASRSLKASLKKPLQFGAAFFYGACDDIALRVIA
jgi:hypothetical protein